MWGRYLIYPEILGLRDFALPRRKTSVFTVFFCSESLKKKWKHNLFDDFWQLPDKEKNCRGNNNNNHNHNPNQQQQQHYCCCYYYYKASGRHSNNSDPSGIGGVRIACPRRAASKSFSSASAMALMAQRRAKDRFSALEPVAWRRSIANQPLLIVHEYEPVLTCINKHPFVYLGWILKRQENV